MTKARPNRGDLGRQPSGSDPVAPDWQNNAYLAGETPDEEAVDPTSMKKKELVAYADAEGVDSSGTKAEILARLEE